MPRARNIKHSFFVNDELANITPLGRLLFIGLWTLADREGRLENKPKKIKIQTLPYDNCNIVNLLNQLEENNFIFTYTVDDRECIAITKWHKHQNPHHMELPSDIPAPPGEQNKYNHKPVTKKQRERVFKRDNHQCVKCGEKTNLTIDHIKPVSKGGTSDDGNLATLCSKCNYSKSNREQVDNDSTTSREQVDNDSTTNADSGLLIPDSCNLKEGGKFKPPSISEIKEYCKERKNGINAEQFHDFYESKNWYIGKNKMKDWKAAVRTWERRDSGNQQAEPIEHRRL